MAIAAGLCLAAGFTCSLLVGVLGFLRCRQRDSNGQQNSDQSPILDSMGRRIWLLRKNGQADDPKDGEDAKNTSKGLFHDVWVLLANDRKFSRLSDGWASVRALSCEGKAITAIGAGTVLM